MKYYKISAVLLLLLIIAQPSWAHVAVNELEKMSKAETAILYLKLGYEHILPLGLDHILFVVSLFLLSPKLKSIIWQSTAFTIAHTITLGLAMYHLVSPPSQIIEPLISLSIVFVAMENIFSSLAKEGLRINS